jgi:hypothetical protein
MEGEVGVTCSTRGEKRNAHNISVRKYEGKIPLEKSRHRWEDNIKMNLQEAVCEDVDCNNLAQDRIKWRVVVNTEIKFWEPKTGHQLTR